MNVHIIGEQKNHTILVTVDLAEVHEAVTILEQLGYSVIRKEPVLSKVRLGGKKSGCLTTLRKMIRKH